MIFLKEHLIKWLSRNRNSLNFKNNFRKLGKYLIFMKAFLNIRK